MARLEGIAGTAGTWDERLNRVVESVNEINEIIHNKIQAFRDANPLSQLINHNTKQEWAAEPNHPRFDPPGDPIQPDNI